MCIDYIYSNHMSTGFYLMSSFMYLNMGCEMMFVLSNRMNAQNINMSTVGNKILAEISALLCKYEFLERILKPQTPISISTLYELLSKIMNSSAMKLDKASNQKLFYLILMTFKKQIFLCSSPLQLYALTKSHLEDLIKMLKNHESANVIGEGLQIVDETIKNYTFMQYFQIREQILSMLQSYKSKIVLFVQSGIQTENGEMNFYVRNAHYQKEVGLGINHPKVDFSLSSQSVPKKKLEYQQFQQWRTDLGKDDYDNIRGSSKFQSAKLKETKEESRSISEMLGVSKINLDNYELKLDLFGDSEMTEGKVQRKEDKKVSIIKNESKNLGRRISEKIESQFENLHISEQKQQDVDLLQMMDN